MIVYLEGNQMRLKATPKLVVMRLKLKKHNLKSKSNTKRERKRRLNIKVLTKLNYSNSALLSESPLII